jgi:hypothetical protein
MNARYSYIARSVKTLDDKTFPPVPKTADDWMSLA